jgi:hypothetical protein
MYPSWSAEPHRLLYRRLRVNGQGCKLNEPLRLKLTARYLNAIRWLRGLASILTIILNVPWLWVTVPRRSRVLSSMLVLTRKLTSPERVKQADM